MKRTYKLFKPEHGRYDDGTEFHRYTAKVEPTGKTLEGRTVLADVDDDSCLYTYECGYLWRFDGELL